MHVINFFTGVNCCALDTLNVSTQSSALPASSSNDVKHARPAATRATSCLVAQQPLKWTLRSAVDNSSLDTLRTTGVANKVQS